MSPCHRCHVFEHGGLARWTTCSRREGGRASLPPRSAQELPCAASSHSRKSSRLAEASPRGLLTGALGRASWLVGSLWLQACSVSPGWRSGRPPQLLEASLVPRQRPRPLSQQPRYATCHVYFPLLLLPLLDGRQSTFPHFQGLLGQMAHPRVWDGHPPLSRLQGPLAWCTCVLVSSRAWMRGFRWRPSERRPCRAHAQSTSTRGSCTWGGSAGTCLSPERRPRLSRNVHPELPQGRAMASRGLPLALCFWGPELRHGGSGKPPRGLTQRRDGRPLTG